MSTNATPFARSLNIQFRIIGALLMREVLTRYGRHNIGFMWMFAEPMMFTLVIAALWSFGHLSFGNIPIIPFAVTGYSTVPLWRNMTSRCSGAVVPNLALMYHRNVKVIDVYISRILLEFAGATMSFTLLTLFSISVGWMSLPVDILKVVLGWFMLTWFGIGLAMTIGSLTEMSVIVEKIWTPITFVLFPLSGAMFMVEWLPITAQKLILYFPMVHGVEILRQGYFGGIVHAHYSMAYMGVICMCLTLIGLFLVGRVSRGITPG